METSKVMTDAAIISALEAGGNANASEAEYHQMRTELKTFAKRGSLSAQSIAVFTIARVLLNQEEGDAPEDLEDRAVKKLTKAFTPITNAKKLANGRRRWDTLNYALSRLEINKDYGQFSHPSEELAAMLKTIAPRLKTDVRALKFTAS